MYYYYESQSIDKLAKQFLTLLERNKPTDPFKKNWIIVQNREMQEWLTLKEASVNSISANNHFIFPSEFIWKLYRMKYPDFPSILPTDRNPLTWSLYELLKNDQKSFEDLGFEYPDDEMHQFQLCKAIADVFDQYQVYRPEMISNWRNLKASTSDKSEIWQMNLWNQLVKEKESSKSHHSRPEVFYELKSILSSGDFPINEFPENLWIFSLPHVSKPFSQITGLLSERINVHHFLSVASELKKSDSAFSYKLLKASLNNKIVILNSVANNQIEKKTIQSENRSDSYLGIIKDIISGIDLRETKRDGLKQDVIINACHNPRREIEVLKDTLLSCFNDQPDLKPEECLVLVPDLNEYSPIISEVFENEEIGSTIPVNKSYNHDVNQASQTLIQLLRLLKSEFKITEVLDLLENPLITDNWKIIGDDLSTIRQWMMDLHVHKQLNGSTFSLFNGVDRLFSGYAMKSESYKSFNEKSVYEKIFNSDDLLLIAKFSSFGSALQINSIMVSREYSLKTWISKIIVLIEQFFRNGDGTTELRTKLSSLNEQIEVSDSKSKVSFSVFFSWLKGEFQNKSGSTSGFGHGVSVSEYVPNRNIPYGFVSILGLNEEVLPSVKTRPEFDLIEKYPMPGDRTDRWEQHYLFHDMIQAAQKFLHISYVGYDQHSETKKDPSVLLQQMLYEARDNGLDTAINEHKLHGFDHFYFEGIKPRSYSIYHKEIAELNQTEPIKTGIIDSEISVAEESKSEINLNDLISFYSDPARYLCINWLSAKNHDSDVEPDSRELFSLDGLDKYFLKELLADAFLNDIETTDIKKIARSKNLIPEGFPGDEVFYEYETLINQLEKLKSEHNFKKRSSLEVSLHFEKILFAGKVENIFESDRIQLRLGDLKAKNLIELWINHIAARLTGNYSSHIYYFKNNKSLEKITLNADNDYYKTALSDLCYWFKNERDNGSVSFYPPETSKEFAERALNGDDINTAIDKALKKWDNNSGYGISENQNFYNNKVYPDEGFLYTNEFQKSAIKFWEPILKATGIVK